MTEAPMARTRKRVGVVTIPRYLNYGTQLQAFALQEAIRDLGYEPEVIDYTLPALAPLSFSGRLVRVLTAPATLVRGFARRRRQRAVQRIAEPRNRLILDFCEQRLRLSGGRYTSSSQLGTVSHRYSAFVVGSDQVWNPTGHLGEDVFFLPFAREDLRVAYAPSIGVSSVDGPAREWLARGVSGIPYLSVREASGANIIKEITNRDAPVVVDPTMLMEHATWAMHAGAGDASLPYLLCYFLQGDAYARVRAEAIAAERGIALVVLPFAEADLLNRWQSVNWRVEVGPLDFVRLIRDAAFVCTDSFHGTVFSVLFRKEFLAFQRYDNPKEAANFSRITGFLGRLGLGAHLASRGGPKGESRAGDLESAHRRLDEWRLDSLNFLRRSLESATA